MIDGIKTKHIELGDQTLLDWSLSVKERGGEVHRTKSAKYKGLTFIAKDGRLFLKGSLHKYFNNGLHNYNDFHLSDLVNVVSEIGEAFTVDPAKILLENVEVGVNVRLPFPVERVLSSLVLHKGEPFFRFSNVGDGAGVECKHAQFYIKVYDKGAQYNVGDNLLRVEIKVVKMAYFQSQNIEIKTLSDLTHPNTLRAMGEALNSTIQEILFTDPSLLSLDSLPEKERLILAKGSVYSYWNSLNPVSTNYPKGNKDSAYKSKRKRYGRELERFEKVLQKHQSKTKETVATLVRDKFTDLLNDCSCRESYELNTYKRGANLPTCIGPPVEHTTGVISEDGTNLHLVYSVSLPSTEKRACLTCGKEIGNMKSVARFCSKKCKNDFTNPRLNPKNNLQSRIKKIERYPMLFPVEVVINLTIEQKEMVYGKNSIYR